MLKFKYFSSSLKLVILQKLFHNFVGKCRGVPIHSSGSEWRRQNVGTWRATSDCCDNALLAAFTQTWHATSLHTSGNASMYVACPTLVRE